MSKRIGPGFVQIPTNLLGQSLSEFAIMRAMQACNPDIHFDVGSNLNFWHPYLGGKQGVWFRERHLGTMDRGTIPMVPLWSTKREGCRVHARDLSYAEMTDKFTLAEVAYNVDGTKTQTGWYFLQRDVRDRLLWVGWHHTLRTICGRGVPGLNERNMSKHLGMPLNLKKMPEELEVAENRTHVFDGKGRSADVG